MPALRPMCRGEGRGRACEKAPYLRHGRPARAHRGRELLRGGLPSAESACTDVENIHVLSCDTSQRMRDAKGGDIEFVCGVVWVGVIGCAIGAGWVVSANPALDCCRLDLALLAVIGWRGVGVRKAWCSCWKRHAALPPVDTKLRNELASTHLSPPPRPPHLLRLPPLMLQPEGG